MDKVSILVMQFIIKLKRLVHNRWLQKYYNNYKIFTTNYNNDYFARKNWSMKVRPPLIHRQSNSNLYLI